MDARIHRRPLPDALCLLVLCSWPVSVPIYLVRSRGLLGIGLAIAHAVGLLVVYGVVAMACATLLNTAWLFLSP